MAERTLLDQQAQGFFEELWQRGDHWEFDSSAFEQTRYTRLMALLGWTSLWRMSSNWAVVRGPSTHHPGQPGRPRGGAGYLANCHCTCACPCGPARRR